MGGVLPLISKAARATVEFLVELAQLGAPKPATPTLAKRLLLVMGELPEFVEKDGENKNQKYAFVSHDMVVYVVRPLLVTHGVSFAAECWDYEYVATGSRDKNGNPTYRTFAKTRYTFTDVETGESRTYEWKGDALDTMDKGLYKALTQSKKTFLINFFQLVTGDPSAEADSKTQDYKGSGKSSSSSKNTTPAARPGKCDQWDNGGNQAPSRAEVESNARRAAVGRVRALAPGQGTGGIDWPEVAKAVSMMHNAGPFDAASPGFTGWTLDQLNELGNLLEEDTAPSNPAGGRRSWE